MPRPPVRRGGIHLGYSPSILWFLDAVECGSGVLPRPDGEVWFTGLPPTRLDHGAAAAASCGTPSPADGAS